MPKRTDLKSILIIGAGPIVIGQACEFDYSGTQACKALREEGYRVILVNSNPATIMTDPEFADVTYIEPLTAEFLEKIIAAERPSALLPTLGGQTALNLAMELHKLGILEKYNVEMIGAKPAAIAKGEDRELFKQAMIKIGLDVAKSRTVQTLDQARAAIEYLGVYPLIIRPSFTLGGQGGGIAYNREEFERIVANGLDISPVHEVLVEECLLGWKEFEMEVMRDHMDQCVVICSIENFDPMGVHTGDSITVAPAMTLTDKEYQVMRDASFAVIREVGVETGGSNIQFAVDPQTGRMVVIEMNPRVSRSSALASKATGFPIAKIAAKLAVGYALDELRNDITRLTPASFEPTIDYIVTKIPRFTFEKFPDADATLTSSMKSVGEAMAIGRTFKESLQKALRSLEIGSRGLGGGGKHGGDELVDRKFLAARLGTPNAERIFYVRYAFLAGLGLDEIFELTRIDPWFLHQMREIFEMEQELKKFSLATLDTALLRRAKQFGFSDAQLAHLLKPSSSAGALMAISLETHSAADQAKLGAALQRIMAGDSTLRVKIDPDTNRTILAGVGKPELEIVGDRLKREFKIEATMGKPQITNCETVTAMASGEGKFIRHSGGRNHYGHISIKLEPNEKGQGVKIVNEIAKGTIPKEFIKPATEGILAGCDHGVVAGHLVVDVVVRLTDGSFHEVDSSEMAFKMAGISAFKDAMKKASPVILSGPGDLAAVRAHRKRVGVETTYRLVDTCAAEFEAFTPYYYSSYGDENEIIPSKKKKIMILGGGPNRIGQGIEFDYCCVHASFALREIGFETVMVNSNPETVSTDYDTSDRLYFEPLTLEDVLEIYQQENCDGAIVQFGGQTPLNLATALKANGVNIIGTSPESIEAAEDRKLFSAILNKLGLKQPANRTALSEGEAAAFALEVGYPVLLRPSFVLGGRGMFIVYSEEELKGVVRQVFDVMPGKPVLIDKFLEDAIELDVDCISDGTTSVIGGMLEHIEFAGVHSGDAAMVMPPHTLGPDMLTTVRTATAALARELHVVGLMNVQFAIKDHVLHVLEVNPRASRTVPFVAKAIGVPLAKLAAKVMTGVTLKDLGFTRELIPKHWCVKEAVFPFVRFPGATIMLGPEMRSTGEVMGLDDDLGIAFAKAQAAAKPGLPTSGNVFLSVKDADKVRAVDLARQLEALGFTLYSTSGTAAALAANGINVKKLAKLNEGRPTAIDLIKNGQIQIVINTPGGMIPRRDENQIRSAAYTFNVCIMTTITGAFAALDGIKALKQKRIGVRPIQQYRGNVSTV